MRTAVLLYILLCGLLNGCGTNSDQNNSTITGKVADGYIRGAIVFWDCNDNKVLDADEISTISGNGGVYSITKAPQNSCLLVVKVPIGAVDEDSPNSPISASYTLVSTRGNEAFVSPLSTLVSAYLLENPEVSLIDAEKAISASLGLSGNINSDYISTNEIGSEKRRGVAKIAATMLQSNNAYDSPKNGMIEALSSIRTASPQFQSINFSSPSEIDSFLNPFRYFLKPSTPTAFKKIDYYGVRPNSSLGLTEDQLNLLDNVIAEAEKAGVIRDGVLHPEEYSYSDLIKFKRNLASLALPLDINSEVVKKLVVARNAHLNNLGDYYSKSLSNTVSFLTSDLGANINFTTGVSIAAVEAVSNAVSVATGVPTIDLRKFRSKPLLRSSIKAVREYKIQEMVLTLLNCVNLVNNSVSPKTQALIQKFALTDGENISQEDYEALLELFSKILDVAKDSFKNKNLKLFAKTFAPAANLYSTVALGCLENSSSKCIYAEIELLESLGEWLHFPTRLQGLVKWFRSTMDAYMAAEEYAEAVTSSIRIERDKVTADYEARVSQAMTFWILQELTAGGVDKLFEAYDPSVSCKSGEVRKHGVCSPSTTSVPEITNLISNSAIEGVNSEFIISGLNLPMAESLIVKTSSNIECTGLTYNNTLRTSTRHVFSCTPTASGTLTFFIYTVGGVELGSWNITVNINLPSFAVNANAYPGIIFTNPLNGPAYCSFTAKGSWIHDNITSIPSGPEGTGNVANYRFPYPSGIQHSLVARRFYSSSAYLPIGQGSGSIQLNKGEQLYFLMNDTLGTYGDNSGSVIVSYSCS